MVDRTQIEPPMTWRERISDRMLQAMIVIVIICTFWERP